MLTLPIFTTPRSNGFREFLFVFCSTVLFAFFFSQGNDAHHRPHRSFEEPPAGTFFPDPAPEDTSPSPQGAKILVFPRGRERREQHPLSCLSSDYESAATPVEAWSPATTDRSTPPYDSRSASSPLRHRANPTLVYESHLMGPRANPTLYDSSVINPAGQTVNDTLDYDSGPAGSPEQHRENPTPPYDAQIDSPLRHRANPTPSYDSRIISPTRQRANRRLGVGNPPASASIDRDGRSSALPQTQTPKQTQRQAQTPSHGGGDGEGGGGGGGGGTPSNRDPGASPLVHKVLNFFQKRTRTRSAKIGSAESPISSRTPINRTPSDRTPANRTPANHTPLRKGGFDDFEAMSASSPAAVPTLASRLGQQPLPVVARLNGQHQPRNPRAPFGGALVRPPSRLEDGGDNPEESSRHEDGELGAAEPGAVARAEAEGDLEEGGVAAVAARATVGEGEGDAVAAVLAEVDLGAATDAAIAVDNVGIVLPCAPSDEEKVSRRVLR